ncbi:MAG: LVIVD repeat-containing protein [Actinomycetes bacterium]
MRPTRSPRRFWSRRSATSLLGVGVLLAGVGIAVLPQTGALADRDRCADQTVYGTGDNFAELCLTDEQIAKMDDSAAELAPGETASSPNVRLLANIPKQGAFSGEGSFNSDLAFKDGFAYAGNYDGFMVYDVRKPREPKIVTQVVCPGSQNDISVFGDILVLSTDSSRSDDSCTSTSQSATNEASWEGIKLFDISNPAAPAYEAAIETDCGSHTHTLAPGKDGKNLYVYVSSYNPSSTFPDCQPPHDKISIVKVPVADMASASLISAPVVFPDGGNPPGGYSRETTGCHDLTAYPAKDSMAGACMGDGVLFDIADRETPRVVTSVRDTQNFAFWHSATFNNAGTKIVFTDELGGGGGPTCNPTVGPNKGADAVYDVTGTGDARTLEFGSYFKIPRTQSNTENCVAHNGSLIPVKGRDIMVQAWYQGGISVWDFTDSANPKELGWFDRGPLSADRLVLGGSWSAYWYNGYIYSNDIQKGFDVFQLTGDGDLGSAQGIRLGELNVQSQPNYG